MAKAGKTKAAAKKAAAKKAGAKGAAKKAVPKGAAKKAAKPAGKKTTGGLGCCTIIYDDKPSEQVEGVSSADCVRIGRARGGVGQWNPGSCA